MTSEEFKNNFPLSYESMNLQYARVMGSVLDASLYSPEIFGIIVNFVIGTANSKLNEKFYEEEKLQELWNLASSSLLNALEATLRADKNKIEKKDE